VGGSDPFLRQQHAAKGTHNLEINPEVAASKESPFFACVILVQINMIGGGSLLIAHKP
jgi:hypothetical protein